MDTIDKNIKNVKKSTLKKVEPVQPVHINIYQSNAYRKDLSWLHFHDEPIVQKRQQKED